MKHVRLGQSGLQVSELILGCMSFGVPSRGKHEWSLNEDDSRPLIRQAVEAGFTTFDLADSYSDGTSEEIVGRALREFFPRREEIVITSKVFFPMWEGANGAGLSRAHLMSSIDNTLRRLQTDYVDLYQIHRFDPETPVEETMQALDDIVRAGKARYIGASSMWLYQFATMQHTAELGGWTKFISMQNQYNLICREDEREMLPYCEQEGLGVIPWSPLARGKLARPWGETTFRTETDEFGKTLYHQQLASDEAVVGEVARIAAERGVSMAQVGLAWVRQQGVITAPIVGATNARHLDDAIASLQLELSDEEMDALEAPYVPRLPEGF